MTTYYEDFSVGDEWTLGTRRVTADEIEAFARQYDPQPMHLSDQTHSSTYDGLIASGWHTAALTMRILVDGLLDGVAVRAGIGVDDLRWPTPLRPGDELAVAVEVVDRGRFDEKRGRLDLDVTTTTGTDDVVLSMVVKGLFGRREQST